MTGPRYCPIAGCAAIANPEAAAYDKRWLVVDVSGQLLTPAAYPLIQQITVSISFGYLAIRGSGMLRLDLPLDVIEDDDSVVRQATIGTQRVAVVDEGDLAAAWVSNFLGVPCRLVKVHPDAPAILWPAF